VYEWAKGNTPTGVTATPTATEPIAAPDHPILPLGGTDTKENWSPPVGASAPYKEITQEEVDKLDPIQRMLRGVENAGHAVFGKENGPVLSGLGDVIGAGGNLIGGVAELGVVKPIEAGASVLAHIPTSFIGGDNSADHTFDQIGAFMKANDPSAYQGWLAVKAKSDADILGGGNMKADFNMEAAKHYDKFTKDGSLGANPLLSMGISGTGSLGGVLSHFLQGAWGIGASNVQGFLGDAGVFDPDQGHEKNIQSAIASKAAVGQVSDVAEYAIKQFQSGAFNEQQANDYLAKNDQGGRSRIQETIARFQRGDETSALEQEAAQHVIDGTWSEKHANDYLIAGGQSITRNPVGQIVGGLVTDPTMLAMGGAGVLAKAAKIGTEALEVGGAAAKAFEAADSLTGAAKIAKLTEAEQLTAAARAETTYQKLGQTLAKVTTHPVLGPIAKAGRSILDPFQLIPHSSVTRGLKDLFNGAAVDAFGSAYGHASISEVRGFAREAGLGQEVDTALASIAQDRGSELMATEMRDNALRNELGNELVKSPVDVSAAVKAAPNDVVVRMSDYITRVRKTIFTPEDIAALSGRTAKSLGGDAKQWFDRISKMSRDTVSTLHTLTAKMAETDFVTNALNKIDRPNYTGDLPLPELTLLNPENIDNITAQALLDEQAAIAAGSRGVTPEQGAAIQAAYDAGDTALGQKLQREAMAGEGAIPGFGVPPDVSDPIKRGVEAWNKAALRYDEIAQIGHATGNKDQLAELVAALKDDLEQGQFHKRALDEELAHPSLAPIVEFLDRNTINGKRLWNVGFRPAEDVSWGLKADRATGAWIAGRTPSINRVIDAVYNQGFADTTRNVLGQIIPDARLARTLNRPIDAMEAFTKTATDVVSGRRLVMNIEQRFHGNMAEKLGVPKAISKDVWKAVSDVAALNRTTVRGLPLNDSVWIAIEKVLPADLVQSGKLNVRNVMGALLDAAEGDLRIMGVTSKMTQRMRNQIMRAVPGFQGNALGELTVTQYNRFRYIQPTFLIQKVTDAPYFMALHGIMPVGTGELTPTLAAVRRIEENMGFTGTARDFAMDYPERALHSNWTEGITNRIKQIVGGDVSRIDAIQGNLPGVAAVDSKIDRYVANNMTKDLSTRMGSVVRESLEEIDELLKLHPDLAADLEATRSSLRMTMADWRAEYSRLAGRVLSEDEVGLKVVQEQMASARRVKAVKDGIDTEAFHHEMTMSMPADFGEVHTIYPDQLAVEMGYADARDLREAIAGKFNPATQQVDRGVLGIDRFKEDLKNEFGADPAYIDRASRYFGDTWESYWNHLAQPVENGGLDLSARSVRETQDLIRVWAKDRGMDPWEYLSQVVGTNLGAEGLDTHIQKIAQFLTKGADAKIDIEDVMAFFKGHMDLSAQRTLVDEYMKTVDQTAVRAPAAGLPSWMPALGETKMVSPSDLERYVEINREAVAKGGGLSTDLAALTEDIKANGIKDPITLEYDSHTGTALMTDGNHRLAAAKRAGLHEVPVTLQPAKRLPSEADLTKAPAGFVPVPPEADAFFEKVLPEQLRQRALSGVAHTNPEIEGYFQHFSKWAQSTLQGSQTRNELRRLVASIPTGQASPFNRFEALTQQVLHDKIRLAQQDVFMLAEMATNRNVLMRSINHPFFGIYPASYMWGKVLPATVRALAKNPYGLTYGINEVQRSIATQREYDPQASIPDGVDKSSVAFLLGYLTPSLPWETMQAQTPPWMRDLQKGIRDPFKIAGDELHTMSPERWYSFFAKPAKEIVGAAQGAFKPEQPDDTDRLQSIVDTNRSQTGSPAPSTPQALSGPTKATGLSPILASEMEQLQRVLSGR
jgi:hypothetical protein